jgi:5,5'-dehydrodivanillate O-demethylase oxygenase subunit
MAQETSFMLTSEENERITRVGPGTPGGELLRRYWQPICVAPELSAEQPTKFVRILGEDLVLFLDKRGNVGLIQDHCAHRGASLLYGRVEERGISCAYHGWLYDTVGDCLETPAEPADSKFYLTVKMRAYPVQQYAGMYWAYLGPLPAPEIPKFDIFVLKNGHRSITVYPNLDCNWFAASENAVDSTHLQILHQDMPMVTRRPENTTRGYIDDIESSDYYLVPYGIMKKRTYKTGAVDEHPMIFPTHLRTRGSIWLRTPIDDTHTLQWTLNFRAAEDGQDVDQEEIPIKYLDPIKRPADAQHPVARFDLQVPWGQPLAQDVVMWETQGPVSDREHERLATSDKGIVMLRELMLDEIAKVERGEDPMGVVRDPNVPMIDTNLIESITMEYPAGTHTREASATSVR